MKNQKYSITVYFWNPNGTNDMAIVDENNEQVEFFPEALFGLNVSADYMAISVETALERIAVSPVTDGADVANAICKYFKVGA